ncbi:MAG TPA: acetyl-CoA acetyltransferase [Actinomycetota bacterium]|nr:acetyl-CoA acetyltransferase [Actinomycetota bacterium]
MVEPRDVEPRVAVVGVGHAGFAPITAGLSYKELMFEAAQRAYDDAAVDPRRDVDSFVCCSEDFLEGTSIFDEYVPDQLGAMQRPVHTVSADGLYGVATAMMLLRSGVARVVAVEAHSKASDIRSLGAIEQFALDPVLNRPLGASALAVAGLDMNAFLERTGLSEEHCAMVAAKNRRNALDNPRAAYPADLAAEDVDDSTPLFWPLRELEVAARADGCVVVVLAAEEVVRDLTESPVWLLGVGWTSGSPTLESRSWGEADFVRRAAERAYAMAGLDDPAEEVDLAEVDDVYAFKELQHLEALGLGTSEDLAGMIEEGELEADGDLPVNVSGGSLGQGNLFEANGLARLLECVEQLRREAGERQVDEAYLAVAQSWRGVPTTSGAVVVLANDEGAGG